MSASAFYPVPAGTRVAQCRGLSCAKPIYFIRLRGKPYRIDCDVPGGLRPSLVAFDAQQMGLFANTTLAETPHDGRGISHFDTCADARQFRTGMGA